MEGNRLFKGLEHIGVKTMDMEKAMSFYIEVLGFEFIRRIKPSDTELIFLKLEETVIEHVEVKDGQHYSDGVINHIAFRVEDIFQAVKWLKSHKVELINDEPRSMGDGQYNFFFRGPSGEKLELFQG